MSGEKVDSTVTIELGGKPRIIEYTLYGVTKYQTLTGKNLLRGEVDFQEPNLFIAFMWAGLIQHDEKLDGKIVDGKPSEGLSASLEEVSKWAGTKKLVDLKDIFLGALWRSTGKKKDGESSAEEGAEKK